MKQHITLKQWQELSLGRQRKFQEVSEKGGLPTIGRMIEFLSQYGAVEVRECLGNSAKTFTTKLYDREDFDGSFSGPSIKDPNTTKLILGYKQHPLSNSLHRKENFCDSLWEAVKEVLNEMH